MGSYRSAPGSFKYHYYPYISGNGTFLCFGKVYSEPWYIQNPNIFKTRSIFKTLVYLEPETYSEHCQTSTMEHFAN